ncbi:DNA-formamidopyrimidine glycosylase [Arthrobacter nitrophenolicus]|uniref:DNA-formamidopyrimidine glycosylase n=1 Tax=Arthrobacter nitrophenolicus TaxID=683150 RepID=L8TP72_9MICC|nr:DNA-formamidopyrimidine glycosylase [Arthrobacter nitrophenolicus]
MPELPEVAGLARFLDEQLRGCVLDKLQIVSFAVLKTADPPYSALEGRTVSGVRRFGKFISIDTDGISLVFHLARAGWLRYTDSPAAGQLKMGKGLIAVRCTFTGPDGPRGFDLTEAGTKKSLAIYVVRDPQDVPGIATLGPDPFAEAFDAGTLAEILAGSSQQIKGLLRSQSVIAGIGNAYSDEILHAARISPFATAKSLDRETVQVLYDAIHDVLGAAWRRPAASRPRNSRTSSGATCVSTPGRACHARCAGTPSGRCLSQIQPCSTAPPARRRARSSRTAGHRSS